MYSNIVLSGGALKIFSIIGALKKLEEEQKLSKLKNFVGCSAGSLVCLFISLNYDISETELILKNFYTNTKINNNIKFNNVINFFDKLGLLNNDFIDVLIDNILIKKNKDPNINFIDFSKTTGKNIIINSSNLTTKKEEFFNVNTHPEMTIKKAIKISMCYPFIFKPISYNNCLYIDGGLYNNFPINYFNNNQLETLGININVEVNNKISNFSEYCTAIIYSVLDKLTVTQSITISTKNICCINLTDTKEFFSFKKLEFIINIDMINEYYQIGYTQFNNFIAKKKNLEEECVNEIINEII